MFAGVAYSIKTNSLQFNITARKFLPGNECFELHLAEGMKHYLEEGLLEMISILTREFAQLAYKSEGQGALDQHRTPPPPTMSKL